MPKAKIQIRDVARHAGVSIGTVSNVLNRPETVSAANVLKVRLAMEAIGFVPNDVARQLKMGDSSTIGMIVLNVANPFFASLAHACETVAEENGLTVVLGSSDHNPSREERYLDLFEKQRVSGLLIAPLAGVTPRITQMHKRDQPVVLFDPNVDPASFCSVVLDGGAAGRQATQHLVDRGRKRLAFVGGPRYQVQDRIVGFEEVVAERDDVTADYFETTDQTFEEGRRIGEDLVRMDRAARPDGIFAANDAIAFGILQTIQTTDALSIPRDMSLVGYDDIDYASSFGLTTIRQPLRALASNALRLLRTEIELGQSAHQHERLLLRPELIVRAST